MLVGRGDGLGFESVQHSRDVQDLLLYSNRVFLFAALVACAQAAPSTGLCFVRLLVYINHLPMAAALFCSWRLLLWRFMLFSLIVAATFGCGNQSARQAQVPCMLHTAAAQHAVVQAVAVRVARVS
jgi:hypothetical protein